MASVVSPKQTTKHIRPFMNHPLASFLGLQGPSGLLIMGLVLLLFAAKKIPELVRGLRKSMNEFKRAFKEYDDDDDLP